MLLGIAPFCVDTHGRSPSVLDAQASTGSGHRLTVKRQSPEQRRDCFDTWKPDSTRCPAGDGVADDHALDLASALEDGEDVRRGYPRLGPMFAIRSLNWQQANDR
jgi:hypothetical protein